MSAADLSIDLSGLTAPTVGVIRLAHAQGLRPAWGAPRGNVRRIVLNFPSSHGPFGSIQIGRKSGRVLRAEIVPGNGRAAIHPHGTNAVRELLRRLAAA